MKKMTLLVPVLAFSAITNALAADKVTLKIGHFLPPLSTIHQHILTPWCSDLNKESKGRIECQLYPLNQLGGTPAQLVDQVRYGVADIVWTAPGYSAGRFKTIEALETPFLLPNSRVGNQVAWKFFEKHSKDGEFKDFKVISVQTDGGVTFHANKPLDNVSDLKGMKLRTPTRLASQVMKALGGEAISIPPSQVAESISKGVVDGAMGAWEVVPPSKLDEVTKYHVLPESGQPYPTVTVLMLLMNKNKYNSMPADLKAIFDKYSGPAMVERITKAWEQAEKDAIDKTLSGKGVIAKYDAAKIQQMQEMTKSVTAQWINDAKASKVDGQKLIDDIKQMVKEQQ